MAAYNDYYGMMADTARIEAYKTAIQSIVKEGDVVLDLGAGLGILSFLCIQQGASKVYAVEERDSINLAKKLAKLNGWSNRIEFLQGNSLKVNLPEKVDVIVSETLGSFGIDENTVEFMSDARNRFLKDSGHIIPKSLNCWLAACGDSAFFNKMDVWNNIEGIDFSPAKDELLANTSIQSVPIESLLSIPVLFEKVDFYKDDFSKVSKTFEMKFINPGVFSGFAGWFDCELSQSVGFSTHPNEPLSHWKQVFYPLDRTIEVKGDEKIVAEFSIAPAFNSSDEAEISFKFRPLEN